MCVPYAPLADMYVCPVRMYVCPVRMYVCPVRVSGGHVCVSRTHVCVSRTRVRRTCMCVPYACMCVPYAPMGCLHVVDAVYEYTVMYPCWSPFGPVWQPSYIVMQMYRSVLATPLCSATPANSCQSDWPAAARHYDHPLSLSVPPRSAGVLSFCVLAARVNIKFRKV